MAKRVGKSVIYEENITVKNYAAHVGKKEGEGPLGEEFDEVHADSYLGEDSWEKSESRLIQHTCDEVLQKAKMVMSEIDCIYTGDLLSQCISSNFAFRDEGVQIVGVYGACSTMALTLINAAAALEAHCVDNAICTTVSHFCSSERQFRFPLQYGSIRTPTSQWTVTGCGATLLTRNSGKVKLVASRTGEIRDMGVKDANNMGASMAPAACSTICKFLLDTGYKLEDFDYIVTGDLGSVGSELLCQLTLREFGIDIKDKHLDCGVMIYDSETQDVHAGGSGCGCSASVLNSYFLKRLESGELKRIMFVATGALLSPTTVKQGESTPCVAHAVILEGTK